MELTFRIHTGECSIASSTNGINRHTQGNYSKRSFTNLRIRGQFLLAAKFYKKDQIYCCSACNHYLLVFRYWPCRFYPPLHGVEFR